MNKKKMGFQIFWKIVNHLLLHCEKAYQLWSLVFRSFGISWTLPKSVANTLFGWWNWFGKHSSSIWNIALLFLIWCIWREQNWRTFEDRDKSDDQLLAYFSGSLFDWSKAWGLTSSDSLPLFFSSLLCNQFFVGFHLFSCFFSICWFLSLYSLFCLMFFMRQLLEYTSFLLIKKKKKMAVWSLLVYY